MAWVPSDTWNVGFTFVDNNGNMAGVGVYYSAEEGLGFSNIEAVRMAAESLASDLQAISNASLVKMTISRSVINDAPQAAAPESEVERKLVMSLSTAKHPNVSRVEVPSPVFTIEIPGTDMVHRDEPLVAALINELTAGLLLPGNGPVTYYGADIIKVEDPIYVAHRRRKPAK